MVLTLRCLVVPLPQFLRWKLRETGSSGAARSSNTVIIVVHVAGGRLLPPLTPSAPGRADSETSGYLFELSLSTWQRVPASVQGEMGP